MPDDEDNRFTNVARALEDADDAADAEGSTDDSSQDESEDEAPASLDEPAFPFRDVTQYPFYARKTSWTALDATWTTVAPVLAERGVTDVQKREVHDAALRVAAADPQALTAAIQRARRQSNIGTPRDQD